ncbi:uncharacterized protein DS421_13g398100 [Arachis hypogaea]|nr:uncharacterized protein DS421_13g398100 [Arachis hypogaea]
MSRATVKEVDHDFRGKHYWDEVNLNISALPTDLILQIFLRSDGKTIGRGRCMSRDWYNRLNRADNMVTHFKSKGGGEAAVLHLDNPLKEADCGRLCMFVFETCVAVPVAAPLAWTWFSMVGTDTCKVCARYSIDGRSSSLIAWDSFGSWRSVIPDPGSDGYHFNHRDEWSAYAFLSMVGSDDYKILSLTKRHLATAGYDMHMYLSSAGRFSKKPVSVVRYATMESAWDAIEIGAGACVDHPTLIGHHDYVDFVTYERSTLRFRVHVMTINLGQVGGMAWGRHLFIGDPNLIDTPCVKFGCDLLGISHAIRDFDGLESSLVAVASKAQFRSVGLTDGVVRFVGRVRWPGVVSIKGCMGFYLEV